MTARDMGSRIASVLIASWLVGCGETMAGVDAGDEAGSDAAHLDAREVDAAPAPRSVEDDLVVARRLVADDPCAEWDTQAPASGPGASWSRDLDASSRVLVAEDGSIRVMDRDRLFALGRDGTPMWSHDLAGTPAAADLAPNGSVFVLVQQDATSGLLQHLDTSGAIRGELSFEHVPSAAWGVGSVVVGPGGRVYVTTDRVHELCRTTPRAELSIADVSGAPRTAGWVAIDEEGALVVTVRDVSRALRVHADHHEWIGTGVPTSSTFASGPISIRGTRVLVAHTEIDSTSPEPAPTWSLSIAQPGGWAIDVPWDVVMLDGRGRTVRDQGAGWGRFWDRDDGTALTLPCDAVHWATERGLLCSAIVDARLVLRDIGEDGSIASELTTGVSSSRGLSSVQLAADGQILWTSPREDGVGYTLTSAPSDVRPAPGWWSWPLGVGRAWSPRTSE